MHLVFSVFTYIININKSLLTSINKLGGQVTFLLAIICPLIPEAGRYNRQVKINVRNNQPTQNRVSLTKLILNSMLPVKCSQTWSVLTYLESPYPSKQVEFLSSGSALTGHFITHSVSVITNMTVSK